jgi:hypothetical protein
MYKIVFIMKIRCLDQESTKDTDRAPSVLGSWPQSSHQKEPTFIVQESQWRNLEEVVNDGLMCFGR